MIIPHLKDDSAQARPGTIDLPVTLVKAGDTFVVHMMRLRDLPNLKAGDMVSLTHLILPKTLSPYFKLLEVQIEDDFDIATLDFSQPLDDTEPGLLNYDVFHLVPVPISPLNKVVVTLKNISDEDRTFEGRLVCQVKHVTAMWFGEDAPTTQFQWLQEITRRASKAFFDWRRERKLLKAQAAKEKEDEEWYAEADREDLPARQERLRDHLRRMAIDMVSVASFPLKAALHLTTKSLEDLSKWQTPQKPTPGNIILNLGSTKVEADKSANIGIQTQVPFRPSMLVIPPHVSPNFIITDIKVGKNSQFASASPLPATAFALPDGTPIPLRMDTASPAMWIILSVSNTSSKATNFEATLVGSVVWE